jgi:hypothetical protein
MNDSVFEFGFCRLCQSAAFERVQALGEDFQRKHEALYRKEDK